MKTFTDSQLLDLIQHAIEEGTGEPCSRTDAQNILTAFRAA